VVSRDYMFNPKVGSKALEMVSVRDTFFSHGVWYDEFYCSHTTYLKEGYSLILSKVNEA